MAILVTDPSLEERLKAEREESGADRFDEVWEGVYVMAPLADDEHQEFQTLLGAVFQEAVGWAGLGRVRTGVNVSDRERGWKHNYRIPDVAVFLPATSARLCGAFWLGGPDFAVEITSPGDRTRDKLPFYEAVGVRELLIVDRDPWAVELYRMAEGELTLGGRSTPDQRDALLSAVLPLSFQMTPASGGGRPRIEISRQGGGQRWLV